MIESTIVPDDLPTRTVDTDLFSIELPHERKVSVGIALDPGRVAISR